MACLNERELDAINKLSAAWDAMVACGTAGIEATAHMHALQHIVMAQPTIRAHVDLFRQKDTQ
jgi:hypothetical protein